MPFEKKSENLSAKSRRGCLDNLAWGWYTSKVPTYAGVLELADETDSKSVGGDTVWVRPPSPAFLIPKPFSGLGIFVWQTRFRLVCHFVCHFYPKWQTKRIYFPLVLADKFAQRSFSPKRFFVWEISSFREVRQG